MIYPFISLLRFARVRWVWALLLSSMFFVPARGVTIVQLLNNGNWSTGGNWSGGQAPNNNGANRFHATITTGGNATLNTAIALDALLINGNGLDGNGTLTLEGVGSEWKTGSLTGIGGTGQLVIESSAALTIETSATKTLNNWAIVNRGLVTWTGGPLSTGNGATITNQAGATFTTNFDGLLQNNLSGTPMVFTNAGTFSKTGGAGSTELRATFNNTSAVNVTTGTLLLSGGGSSSGVLTISSGAAVRFSTADYTIAGGSQLNGSGTIEVAGATTTFSGAITGSANLSLIGGTALISGTTTLGGGLGMGASGILDGAGTLTAGGPFAWSGGDLRGGGILNANAGGTISGGGVKQLVSRTLNLLGTTSWTGGPIYTGGGSIVTNKPGATFMTDFDGTIHYNLSGARATFANEGTFTKSGAAGTTQLQTAFNNTGVINVQAGTLELAGGGASSGTATISSGATLKIASNDYAFTTGAVLNALGTGTLHIAGPTATFSGTNGGTANLSVTSGAALFSGTTTLSGHVALSGGSIDGVGTLSTSGAFNWSGGDLRGGGILNANAGGTISGGGVKQLVSRTLNLLGTTTWTAGPIYTGGGSIVTNKPGATFTTDFDGTIHYNLSGARATFANEGTFTKSGAAGTTQLQTIFNNPGVINVQAGTLELAGGGASSGTATISSGATLKIASNDYAFTTGAVLNALGTGTLHIAGPTATFIGTTGGTANLLVTSGAALFSGTTTLSGHVALSGGSIDGVGALSTSGAFNWSGGDLRGGGILNANAGGTISGGGVKQLVSRTLNLFGTTSWTGGPIYTGGGSIITNKPGATFNVEVDGTVHYNLSGARATFMNEGTLAKIAGTGDTQFFIPVTNSGTISVATGKVHLLAGGSNASGASLLAGANTELVIGADYALADNSLLTGAGVVRFTNGVLTLNGTAVFGNFSFDGGTLSGTHTLKGNVTWRGGNWSAGALGPVTTVDSGATLTLASANAHEFGYRAIVNQGTVNWQGNYLSSANGGSFLNALGATFNDSASSYIYRTGAGSFVFTNNGTYNKTAAGETFMDTTFNNHGRVNVSVGNLELRGGGSNSASGLFEVATGAAVRFGGAFTVANGAALTGSGSYQLAAGTLTIGGDIGVSTFNQTGGTLAGAQTFTSGVFNWHGGDWNAGAPGPITTIAHAATLNLKADNPHTFDYRGIVNHGTVHWEGNYLSSGHGGSFLNASDGVFNDSASSYIYNPSGGTFTFTNQGVYNKTTTGTTFVQVPFANHGGTVNVAAGTLRFTDAFTQTAGTLAVAAGAVAHFEQGLSFASGLLTGSGTLQGNVANGGVLSPGTSTGTLAIAGNLSLLSTSTLLIQLGGATQGGNYDFVSVSGLGTLGGSLSLQFLNGFQASISPTATFIVLTADGGNLSGAFSNIANGQRLPIDGLGSFQVNYGLGSAFAANSLVLSQFAPVPEPSTWALMIGGIGALLFTLRRKRSAR